MLELKDQIVFVSLFIVQAMLLFFTSCRGLNNRIEASGLRLVVFTVFVLCMLLLLSVGHEF
jgi:hypothetical protein